MTAVMHGETSSPDAETGGAPGIAAADSCRLTVIGPDRRADLSVPLGAIIGDLLPMLATRLADDRGDGRGWVLQRLGEEPLDPAGTAELADLREGDVLYLRPEQQQLPAAEFDDLAVGVAVAVSARPGRWQPAQLRGVLLGLAAAATGVFAAAALARHPAAQASGWLAAGALALAAAAVLARHVVKDQPAAAAAGLCACGLAALAGLSARHGLAGVLGPSRQDLVAGSAALAVVAVALLAAIPGLAAPLGAALVTGLAGVAGATLALAARWSAASAAALLAVVVFATAGVAVRLALRAARLQVPLVPGDAEQLQEDIEPQPAARVSAAAIRAASYLDSLTAGGAVVYAVAGLQLSRVPGWAGLALAAVLGVAVLLRARTMAGLWQRVFLAAAAALMLGAAAAGLSGRAGSAGGAALLAGLLAAALLLLVAARRLPGVRLLPMWGHAADLLETWTAIALVPLLLELLHAYSYVHGLIG